MQSLKVRPFTSAQYLTALDAYIIVSYCHIYSTEGQSFENLRKLAFHDKYPRLYDRFYFE